MSKAKWALLPLLLLPFLCVKAEDFRIVSPDGLTYLDVKLADGRLCYSAGYRQIVKAKKKGAVPDTIDVPVLLESPLGLKTNVADLSKDLTFIKEVRPEGGTYKHSYHLRGSKQSEINSEENGIAIILTNPEAKKHGLMMTVGFRVFNNNIAYSYRLVQGGETSAIVVTEEVSITP